MCAKQMPSKIVFSCKNKCWTLPNQTSRSCEIKSLHSMFLNLTNVVKDTLNGASTEVIQQKGEMFSLIRTTSCFNWITVVAILWARVSCHLALQEACLRMRITLGFIFIRSLVYAICVLGRLRSGSRVALN